MVVRLDLTEFALGNILVAKSWFTCLDGCLLGHIRVHIISSASSGESLSVLLQSGRISKCFVKRVFPTCVHGQCTDAIFVILTTVREICHEFECLPSGRNSKSSSPYPRCTVVGICVSSSTTLWYVNVVATIPDMNLCDIKS